MSCGKTLKIYLPFKPKVVLFRLVASYKLEIKDHCLDSNTHAILFF